MGMMMPETCWDTNKYIVFLHLVYIYISYECRCYALGIGVVNNSNRGSSNCFWSASSSLLLRVRGGEPTAVRELQDVYPFSRTQSVWVVNEDRKKTPTIPSPLLPQQYSSPLPHMSVCPCTSGLFKKYTTFSLASLLQKRIVTRKLCLSCCIVDGYYSCVVDTPWEE
jgi:hypothetical protein